LRFNVLSSRKQEREAALVIPNEARNLLFRERATRLSFRTESAE
jgi:hypothetical protein